MVLGSALDECAHLLFCHFELLSAKLSQSIVRGKGALILNESREIKACGDKNVFCRPYSYELHYILTTRLERKIILTNVALYETKYLCFLLKMYRYTVTKPQILQPAGGV